MYSSRSSLVSSSRMFPPRVCILFALAGALSFDKSKICHKNIPPKTVKVRATVLNNSLIVCFTKTKPYNHHRYNPREEYHNFFFSSRIFTLVYEIFYCLVVLYYFYAVSSELYNCVRGVCFREKTLYLFWINRYRPLFCFGSVACHSIICYYFC